MSKRRKDDSDGVKAICLQCIADTALRVLASRVSGSRLRCDYCGTRRKCLTLVALAEIVEEALREFCCVGEFRPILREDSDSPDFEREGESLANLLEAELEIPYEACEELASILVARDPADVSDGDEPFFSDELSYHRTLVYSGEYGAAWEEFRSRIQHGRRFFDEGSRELLAQILGAPGDDKARALPVLEIGPGTKIQSVFRARRADRSQQAEEMLRQAARELGPPPPEIATAGRMNAAGIRVFYGALSAETAIAELRPSVGGLVVHGEFRVTRTMRLLDLSQVHFGFSGSIFDSGYGDRASRRRFMEGFHNLIARPVHPRDEPLEYIPTQAVAEYVANILGFDGILYASAQVGAVPEIPDPSPYVMLEQLSDEDLEKHNVVLFGAAAAVLQSERDERADRTSDQRATNPAGSLQPFDAEAQSESVEATPSLEYVVRSGRGVTVTSVRYTSELSVYYDPDWKSDF